MKFIVTVQAIDSSTEFNRFAVFDTEQDDLISDIFDTEDEAKDFLSSLS